MMKDKENKAQLMNAMNAVKQVSKNQTCFSSIAAVKTRIKIQVVVTAQNHNYCVELMN